MTEDTEARPEGEKRKRPQLDMTHSEDVPLFYANNVATKLTPWDLTMNFGIITDTKPGRITVKDTATVVMSPQHAKVFSQLLTRNIEKYEKRFGVLPISADDDDLDGDEDGDGDGDTPRD